MTPRYHKEIYMQEGQLIMFICYNQQLLNDDKIMGNNVILSNHKINAKLGEEISINETVETCNQKLLIGFSEK